jgi:hypothetical protein
MKTHGNIMMGKIMASEGFWRFTPSFSRSPSNNMINKNMKTSNMKNKMTVALILSVVVGLAAGLLAAGEPADAGKPRKEFKGPKLPVVLGEPGVGGKKADSLTSPWRMVT